MIEPVASPDCIAVFRYGFRSPTNVGPTNRALITSVLAHHGTTPIVTSQRMSRGFEEVAKLFPTVKTTQIVAFDDEGSSGFVSTRPPAPGLLQVFDFTVPFREEQSRLKQRLPRDAGASKDLVRHDTTEFMSQALALAELMGWQSILPVAVTHQVKRIDTIARLLGRTTLGDAPYFLPAEGMQATMDPKSEEPWTRSDVVATAYETTMTAVTRATLGRDSLGLRGL